MTAPDVIKQLVDRFDRGRSSYRAATYNETQVRREFIDPFFTALGWDVDNKAGYAEAYKDVVHEDRVSVAGSSKAPDYSFRVGGVRKFFVEAKKPSVNLREDPLPAFQLRRYAWSAKLPLSVLTDFEEFVVYDCRQEPNARDRSDSNRLLYIRADEYVSRWNEIEEVFSRDAILKGSFDSYAVSLKGKRGTSDVDRAFLSEMESWRADLAKTLVSKNDLTQRELNFAVQQTIDRIVFLRICEDRGIEPYGSLQEAAAGPGVYQNLLNLFHRADDRYNSGLFHFRNEPGRDGGSPDTLTPTLDVADGPLQRLIKRLYYPNSPYEFKVLPADILGQVYEQFLGKTILKTSARRIAVEEKPEVTKAGGIVYTPTSVVDYIIDQALRPLISSKEVDKVQGKGKGKTKGKVKVEQPHPVRVLDPACGSGSFLIAAYQELLDWYLGEYSKTPETWAKKKRPRVRQNSAGDWVLTVQERRRILLDHIYGVDIDSQAVEVTKLSLLLKVLEGESDETIGQQQMLFQERALPDISSNIRCGNSLIGPEYLEGRLWDDEELMRVNVFDWHQEFPHVFRDGGFDSVIGNPPYVLLQDEFRDDDQLAYFRDRYEVASFKLDLYHLFMEQALKVTRSGGLCSMITPSNFLTNNYLAGLREHLLDNSQVDHIAVVDGGVFDGRSVDNAIYVVRAGSQTTKTFDVRKIEPGPVDWTTSETKTLSAEIVRATTGHLFTGSGDSDQDAMWTEVDSRCTTLGALAAVNFGKQLRDRKKFLGDVVTFDKIDDVAPPYRPCYTGGDVTAYRVTWNGLACLDTEDARKGGTWDRTRQDAKNKLLTRQIGKYPVWAIDTEGHQCLNTIFMVNITDDGYDPYLLLAYLNSKPLAAYWIDHFWDQRRTFPKIKGSYLKDLPVPLIDGATSEARKKLSQAGAQMTKLARQLSSASTDQERVQLERVMKSTQQAIDEAASDWLGLTPEHRARLESTATGT